VAVPYLLAALSGALYFLGFAGFGMWPLAFVALVPVLWALDPRVSRSPRALFGIGLCFGLVTNAGGYYWLVGMLENFSGFAFAWCLLIAALLWAYQGLVLVAFVWLYRLGRRGGLDAVLAASASMCLAEWSVPLLFEHYFGASLHALPVAIQVSDVGGPLLLTGLLTAANAGLYTLVRSVVERRPAYREPALALGLWVLSLGYGAYRLHEVDARSEAAPKLRVGIVQANMGLSEKREDPDESLRRHLEQSEALTGAGPLDLLVWPETAYGWYIPERTRVVRQLVFDDRVHVPTLFGGLSRREVNGQKRPFNTAFLADARGILLGSYDKRYLLAFGEYIPLGEWFPFLYELSPNSGRFAPGTHTEPLALGPYRLSVLICYEDILPGFVRGVVRDAAPHLLVNLSNDAWFGDTHEPHQHLALAKLRAVEHHRALVRATNSGVSAVIDPAGRVVTESGVFTRENLRAEVPLLQGAYAYAHLGDFPALLSVLALGAAYVRTRRARGASRR
jgi:apolipoprotein N-acyltransferase